MTRPRRLALAALAAFIALAATPATAQQQQPRITATDRAHARAALDDTPAARPAAWNQIMGAGDIDADPDQLTPSDPDLLTAELLRQAQPASAFTFGDNQYPWGQIENYQNPDGFSGSWGRPEIRGRLCGVSGNHDYLDPLPGPAGFLAYFQPNCPHRPDLEYASYRDPSGVLHRIRTAYAVRPAPGSGWWAYVLDSQCTHHDRPITEFGPNCSRTGNMLSWFRAHMAAHPTKRRLVIWHHPRWVPGVAGVTQDDRVADLYAVAAYHSRACLVVNGHFHEYARFTSILPDGRLDPTYQAPRTLIVGTGGAQLIDHTGPARPGLRYWTTRHHGVIRVTLGADRWTSEFDGVDGIVRDLASGSC